MVQGYCMKEKAKREMKNPKFELNKLCRPIARGECAKCGTKMYKILPGNEVPADLKAKMAACKSNMPATSRKSKKSKSGGSRKSKGSRKSRKSGGSRKSRTRK